MVVFRLQSFPLSRPTNMDGETLPPTLLQKLVCLHFCSTTSSKQWINPSGMLAWGRSLRERLLKRYKIGVTTICPGFIMTDIVMKVGIV